MVKKCMHICIHETYKIFNRDHPDMKIGYSEFYTLRPKCLSDLNFKLLLEGLKNCLNRFSAVVPNVRKTIPSAAIWPLIGVTFNGGPTVSSRRVRIPGYQYCVPGTKFTKRLARGDPVINSLDRACKEHDTNTIYSQNKENIAQRNIAVKVHTEKAWNRVKARNAKIGETAAACAVTNAMKMKSKLGMGVMKKKKKLGLPFNKIACS